ncbi:MAG: amino acid adenylation domain-containing protein, partial [bacterium]|nr:amino acid adenylation domain-containing protein [bacterium]
SSIQSSLQHPASGTQLTYKELNEKSNRLAHHLQSKGVKPGTIVAIMVERTIEMIIGQLGIWKAGAAYLPIEPAYPHKRINYILTDSNVHQLVTTRAIIKDSPSINTRQKCVYLEDASTHPQQTNPGTGQVSTCPAFVIYTSGTTGRPKGTLIRHRSLVNLCFWHNRYYNIAASDRATQYAGYAFDASVWEIYPYLITGAAIHIIGDDMKLEVRKLAEYYRTERISVTFLPTQFCGQFMEEAEEIPSLRLVLAGGDKLTRYRRRTYQLYNNYGPTENTVVTTTCPVEQSEDNIPIGKPVANTQVYILHKNTMHMQPPGVAGELCVSGDGLAAGYLNQPELTAEKFINYPLPRATAQTGELHQRLYKTGDLAQWHPDGNIRFMGRIDQQVKIRGFRIELGEIENRLLAHPEIKEAVVIARESKENDNTLCAYYVAESTKQPESGIKPFDLKGHLSQFLPQYMIPTYFIQLEKIPLTLNGKIDRKTLPAPEIKSAGLYEAPANPMEKALADVWRQVLNIDETHNLSTNDNYFSLGGDSIKTIQIASRLRKYDLKLEVKDMFTYQTIEQLAPHVKKISRESLQDTIEGRVPLTPIQHWFFQSSFTRSFHFNQSVMIYREEGFDETILEKTFSKIIQHHDALRMVYEVKTKTGINNTSTGETGTEDMTGTGTTVFQQNRGIEGELFHLEVFDFKNLADENVKTRLPREATRLQAGINLNTGPLVKLGLFKTAAGDHLLITIHHLVVDGVSWRILLEDIQTGLKQTLQGEPLVLPEKTDSFKYWSEKLTQYASGEYGKTFFRERGYWETVERTEVKPLPVDRETGKEKQ